MPDPADKGRPSSAPLSVEDADRLADSFTPFWEDSRDPSSPVAAQPPAVATPAPGTVTAPMPAVGSVTAAAEPAPKLIGKQTLLGIAPLTAQRQAASLPPPPPAPIPAPVVATPPLPVTEPVVTAQPLPVVTAQPLPVVTARPLPVVTAQPLPVAAPREPEPIAVEQTQPLPVAVARSPVPPSAVQQSSPDVLGYAIAYTPKDGPSTPAVVIAPDAESSPENVRPAPPPSSPEPMRPLAETVPSIVRSAPKASLAPLAAPAEPDDENPFGPKRSKGKVFALSLGGAGLLLAAVMGVRELDRDASKPSAQVTPHAGVVPTATAVAPPPTSEPVAATQPSKALDSTPPRLEVASVAAPAGAPAKRTGEANVAKTKAKAEPVSGNARSTSRTSSASSPNESSPTPTKPASKGVIVRDAPF